MSKYAAENDAAGCHPLLVCTDHPQLCPPACSPVVRNAGSNAPPVDPIGTFCEHGHHFQDPEPCEGCWPEATAELCGHGVARTNCTDHQHAETEPTKGAEG